MTKKIVSNMQWTDAEITQLPEENGFRMRGLETTRLDTLIDAAFAFVLSILVISSDVPKSIEELFVGIKMIPALAASFAMLMMFWLEHRRWSRRFGLETKTSILLSLSLVFVLLIYVFPLRLLFEGMFSFLSNGYFPFEIQFNTVAGARGFFLFYSVGFLVMTAIVACLYRLALISKATLALTELECLRARGIYVRWLIFPAFALVSIVLIFTLPIEQVHWAAFIYYVPMLIQYIHYRLDRNKINKVVDS